MSPFLTADRPLDKNNVQPRLGFAYSMNDRTVLRGGFGKHYGETGFSQAHWTNLWAGQVHPVILYDGRPDFLANPYNGPVPTFEQAKALQDWRVCSVRLQPVSPRLMRRCRTATSRQSGFSARSAASSPSRRTTYTATRHATYQLDVNLAHNPATGYNYPFTDRTRKPFAPYGGIRSR